MGDISKKENAKIAELINKITDSRGIYFDEEIEKSLKKIRKKNEKKRIVVERLIQLLRYGSIRLTRNNVIKALGVLKDKSATEPLIQALSDMDEAIRRGAALALGKIKDPRAVEPLIKALKDRNGVVRSLSASALAKIGDTKAVEPLIQALSDNEEDVRWQSARALSKIGDERALKPLTQVLQDKSEFVRGMANQYLEDLKQRLERR